MSNVIIDRNLKIRMRKNSSPESHFIPNLVGMTLFVMALISVFDLSFDSVGVSFFVTMLVTIAVTSFYLAGQTSLKLALLVFTLVFLNLIPWIHYSERTLIWRSVSLKSDVFFIANAVVAFSVVLLHVIHLLIGRKILKGSGFQRELSSISSWKAIALLGLSLSGFLITFAVNNFSFLDLFFRGLVDEVRATTLEGTTLNLLIGQPARFLPFFIFAYAICEVRGRLPLKIILFCLLVLTVFPTGVARYMVGMVYIPVLLFFVKPLRRARFFFSMILVSLFQLFPFLDQFRSFSGLDKISILPSPDFFKAAHFDAYENLASAIDYEYISGGWQLLGVILFFVPRSIWTDKPVGSGSQMADDIGYEFNNISMPFVAEGFVNFGYFGVFVFVAGISILVCRLDSRYRGKLLRDGPLEFSDMFYLFLVGSLFFVLRGDLLSSTAYLTAGVFVYFFVRMVTKSS